MENRFSAGHWCRLEGQHFEVPLELPQSRAVPYASGLIKVGTEMYKRRVLVSWAYVCTWPCVRHTLIQQDWKFHFLRSWQGLSLQMPRNHRVWPQPGKFQNHMSYKLKFKNHIYTSCGFGRLIYCNTFLLRFKPEPLRMVFGSLGLSLQYQNPPRQAPAGKGCGIDWCMTV